MGSAMTMREVALLEEHHVAKVLRSMADEWRPIGGGVMSRGAPGAWFNRAQGLGLDGPVDPPQIEHLITYYEERGIEPRVEVCPFAHDSLVRGLADQRFVVRRFLIVLYRVVSGDEDFTPPHAAPPELRIEVVGPGDADAIESFARAWVVGFDVKGEDRVEETMRAARRVIATRGSIGIRAMMGDRCVGAGGLEIDGALASLFGVSVAPDMRRKGIQLAMLSWRLREAARHDVRIATIESHPGASTESNAMRMGFTPAYTKATLVRPGEGLTPVAGG